MSNDTDQKTYIKGVCEKLIQDDFELIVDKAHEFDITVATKKRFKLSWFATQMNIFVIMSYSDYVSRDVIKDFSKISLDYALEHSLIDNIWLPWSWWNLQANGGVVSFALLVSPIVSEDARQWVQQRPQMHFAVSEMPVIFDLRNDRLYYYDKTPIWGALYYKFFRNLIDKYLK